MRWFAVANLLGALTCAAVAQESSPLYSISLTAQQVVDVSNALSGLAAILQKGADDQRKLADTQAQQAANLATIVAAIQKQADAQNKADDAKRVLSNNP
jgi:hypothetical protein